MRIDGALAHAIFRLRLCVKTTRHRRVLWRPFHDIGGQEHLDFGLETTRAVSALAKMSLRYSERPGEASEIEDTVVRDQSQEASGGRDLCVRDGFRRVCRTFVCFAQFAFPGRGRIARTHAHAVLVLQYTCARRML